MKVHLVFSLNVTGSFADDIIHVFGSVRYRLYGKLLANKVIEIIRHRIKMNEKVLSHFIAEKIIFALCYNATTSFKQIFFPEGTQPSWQIKEIPGGGGKGYEKQKWGVYKAKVPSVVQGGGGGVYRYFQEQHTHVVTLVDDFI